MLKIKDKYLPYITLFLFILIIIMIISFIVLNIKINNSNKKIPHFENIKNNQDQKYLVQKEVKNNTKDNNIVLNKYDSLKEFIGTKYNPDNNKYVIDDKIREDFKRSKIKIDSIEVVKYKEKGKIYYSVLVFEKMNSSIYTHNIYMYKMNFINDKLNIINRRYISNVYRVN